MQKSRIYLLAALLGTALAAPGAYAASTDQPKQVTPPPTAGGNSAEPEKSGRTPAKGAKSSTPGSNTAQPSAGGNSAEPDKTKGGKGSVGNVPGKDYKSHDPSYPSAGGNSASKDAPARTSEKPEKK